MRRTETRAVFGPYEHSLTLAGSGARAKAKTRGWTMRVPTADVRNPPVLESRVNRPGPDRKHLFVVCDDGVAYEFERWSDERVFTPVARWDGADRNASPARLPSAVEIFVRNYCARNDLHLS